MEATKIIKMRNTISTTSVLAAGFKELLTMPYPIIPVGVVAGKAMIDGGYKTDED